MFCSNWPPTTECLTWATDTCVGDYPTCSDGDCIAGGCVSVNCTPGQRRCINEGSLATQVCGDHNGDGCLEWGQTTNCDPGAACVGGHCSGSGGTVLGELIDGISGGNNGVNNGTCQPSLSENDDGNAAVLWSNDEPSWDIPSSTVSGGGSLAITSCLRFDFGSRFSADKVCIDAWRANLGCPPAVDDTCDGPCQRCFPTGDAAPIRVWTHATSQSPLTLDNNKKYHWQGQFDMTRTGPAGSHMCFTPAHGDVRYILVCRGPCAPTSWNIMLDYVYLEY